MTSISEKQKQEYSDYIKKVTPTHNTMLNVIKAFFVGGTICCIGQLLLTVFQNQGMDKETAAAWNLICLIGGAVLLTGINVFPKIAKFAGAGALVPITGFANSVAAPAIEYKKEGQVFGIGCKIFTISGPVILYGIFSSWVLGVGYLILKWLGWIS